GQEDVVVGTPTAGRTRREVEGLIGFFVNMLPLRVELSGEPSWRELLGRVREAALGAYAHQDLPFERLVEELASERSLIHTPFFQVTFALDRSTDPEALALGDLLVEPLGSGAGVSKFDLDLSFVDEAAALRGVLTCRAALFEPETIARMGTHLGRVLEALAAAPQARVSEVPLLSAAERAQLLGEGSAPPEPIPQGCVHELFAAQAARTPHAVALVHSGGTWSYTELDARADRLARALRREGVGPEQVVGIFLEHSLELVAALLGTLRAGGCCLLLDPEHPAARNAALLEDAGVQVVVAPGHLRERLPRAHTALRVLDPAQEGEGSGGGEEVPLPSWSVPESAAYVIYTSGSTGTPKGVRVSHAAAAAHLVAIGGTYGLSAGERVLAFAAQTFDPFLEQTLAPLLVGASVALRDPGVWTPAEFAERVGTLRITVADVPPAYLAQLVREGTVASELKRQLRLMIVGGEALPSVLVRAWEEVEGGPVRLLNAYGPTEAVVTATVQEIGAGRSTRWGASVPIGRAVSGRATYVLDPAGEPVPVGVPGELYVGGRVLAREYVGRAQQTSESFVPDPFSGEAGARLYRTGDRVRWLTDGTLEYLGRMDAQVKVRGVRIEPGEVEAALQVHRAVREAVAVVREDARGEKRLVAYVVPEAGTEVTRAELRAHLRERVPEHMVPSAFVLLERLPLNANGKVDRRALPVPERAVEEAYVGPRTEAEAI
ncbi:MAG: amino acid adenylation domain-containing protein, partial [Gemmatimonadetes bacterium]|nr:amino acid adenylation domain-containing protein [Gemmatimonadota bacterium]